MTACMGGWCTQRDKCPHYSAPSPHDVAERLCLTGRDGIRAIDAGPFRVISIEVLNGREVAEESA